MGSYAGTGEDSSVQTFRLYKATTVLVARCGAENAIAPQLGWLSRFGLPRMRLASNMWLTGTKTVSRMRPTERMEFVLSSATSVTLGTSRIGILGKESTPGTSLPWIANLDAIWAREPSTIAGNLNQARKLEEFGFPNVIPEMGPFPLSDTLGMKSGLLHLVEVAGERKVGRYTAVRDS